MRPNYQFIATSSLLLGTTCTECFHAPTSFSQKRSLAIDGSLDGIVTKTFGTIGNDPRQKRIRNTRFYASGSQNSESIKKEGQATTNEVVDDNPLNRILVSIPFLKPQEARLKEGQGSDSSGDEDNPFAKLLDALPQFNFGESDEVSESEIQYSIGSVLHKWKHIFKDIFISLTDLLKPRWNHADKAS